MTVVNFSFTYADLIGNPSGKLIYTSPSWFLKGIFCNLNGSIGSLPPRVVITANPIGGFNGGFQFVAPSLNLGAGVFTHYNRNLINMSSMLWNVQNDLTLIYDSNGSGPGDPMNLVISGNITI